MCSVGSPLNSHPSWLVTRLSAALPLPSSLAITPDLEALYLNHITWPGVLYFPFEVTRVRHLSGPVWVYFPLSRHILISWSDFLCVSVCAFCACLGESALVCVQRHASMFVSADRGLFVGWGWLTGWWEDNMLRTTSKRTWNSFIVTIMNLRENPCVCSLAIEAGSHGLPGTVSHRCPSLKDSAAPESFQANNVVISTAVRAAWPWDKLLH